MTLCCSPATLQESLPYSPEATASGRGGPKTFADLGALDDWLTYRDFSSQVKKVAAGLTRGEFKKGDVMVLYAPNDVRYPVAFHAAAALGGVPAPCPVSEPASSLSELLMLVHPRVIVTPPTYYRT